jgi:hypothetical protein
MAATPITIMTALRIFFLIFDLGARFMSIAFTSKIVGEL